MGQTLCGAQDYSKQDNPKLKTLSLLNPSAPSVPSSHAIRPHLEGSIMTTTKSILIISRDRVLQHTRRLIFEHAGYHVSSAHTEDEAIRFVESSSFSLVLLCHTVPEKSRLFLVGKLKELRPTLPILMLYNSYDITEAKVDGSLHSLDPPTALLNMIGFLTQEAMSAEIN
jgi:CheY-like chemotaxis protein